MASNHVEATKGPPKDTYSLVYQSFFMLGIGTLFPWNSFITATSYYMKRFCGSPHELTFESDIGIAYMVANLVVLCVVVRYQNLFTRRLRVLGSFVVWFVLFGITTLLVLFEDVSAGVVYWVTVLSCILSGVFSATCSGGVFGMVAQFPPVYMGAVMAGQGLSGLTAALVSMGAALADESTAGDDGTDCDDGDDGKSDTSGGDDDGSGDDGDCSTYDEVDWGTFAYFLVACIIFVLCIMGYVFLETSRFSQYYDRASSYAAVETMATHVEQGMRIDGDDGDDGHGHGDGLRDSGGPSRQSSDLLGRHQGGREEEEEAAAAAAAGVAVANPLVAENAEKGNVAGAEAMAMGNGGGGSLVSNQMGSLGAAGVDNDGSLVQSSDPVATTNPPPTLDDYRRVLYSVRGEAFSAWAVFAVTISLFPTVTSLIRLQHPKGCGKADSSAFTDETFTAFLFVLFNLLDLVGRTSAGFVQLISPAWLPVAAALRCVFVPLFLLCNIRGSEFQPVFFRDETWPCLFMVLMALSNGYTSTLAMIYGPQQVNPEGPDAETAGSIMILALTCGLCSGAGLSYLMVAVATGF